MQDPTFIFMMCPCARMSDTCVVVVDAGCLGIDTWPGAGISLHHSQVEVYLNACQPSHGGRSLQLLYVGNVDT